MAYPLKSGADLYTQEIRRVALQNEGSDLPEYITGSIYFNTNSANSNSSNRIRYRGLSAWHSVANIEDIESLQEQIDNIDFASSEEFTSLKDRVDAFLDGEVDSDAVLDNLKEIQDFLDAYDGATSLVDLLATKADKATTLAGYGITDAYTQNAVNNLLANYAPLTGTGASGTWGIDISGSAAKLNGRDSSQYVQNDYLLSSADSYTDVSAFSSTRVVSDCRWKNIPQAADSNYTAIGSFFNLAYSGDWMGQLFFNYGQNEAINYRRRYNGTTWSDWKTIAFTDSNITGNAATATLARKLTTLSGFDYVVTSDAEKYIVFGEGAIANGYNTYLDGNSIRLRAGSGAGGIIINSSSNTTIGGSDKAGTNYKLYVDGKSRFAYVDVDNQIKIYEPAALEGWGTGTYARWRIVAGAGGIYWQAGNIGGTTTTGSLYLSGISGAYLNDFNVLATNSYFNGALHANKGLLIPTGQTLQIGDATISWDSTNSVLKVDKDFASDGQVSSGGIADEAASGGSGLEKVVFTLGAGQTSYECAHNLATREITVSIYEEGDDYQQVLTDVYLDDVNTARIVFGSATDVAHKVVIVG